MLTYFLIFAVTRTGYHFFDEVHDDNFYEFQFTNVRELSRFYQTFFENYDNAKAAQEEYYYHKSSFPYFTELVYNKEFRESGGTFFLNRERNTQHTKCGIVMLSQTFITGDRKTPYGNFAVYVGLK